uniref:Uncharacterized protein AlNc14C319G10569 n=1 Tax=Albugo laibachii Nc14 TaxID=890382 RepID=F0WWD6_9STRA|nr:conserved hypothetical protein [Albugo laibachii Nc14]|eukprot:CCA25756.1 conserved hypothetical protein [Albugo laibachii Nc14]
MSTALDIDVYTSKEERWSSGGIYISHFSLFVTSTSIYSSYLSHLQLQTSALLERNVSLLDREWIQKILQYVPDTVPEGVTCNKVKRCDRKNVCAIVCERGSVQMKLWASRALHIQRQASYERDICTAQLPSSHNSAITLADGYGIEDHIFEGYLRYISWISSPLHIHTNNQHFSLTDQLQLGVRFIELDVHWVDDDLRIAHCGGFRSKLIDEFVKILNDIAKHLGTEIEWDSETIGCKPSLSSIPAIEQRSVDKALEEIAIWLHANENEFLLVFFDDDDDLADWNKVKKLINYIKAHFPKEEIVAPSDIANHHVWPTFRKLMVQGKRILFMSGANYSGKGDTYLFIKESICNWTEPAMPLSLFPQCKFPKIVVGPTDTHDTIFRPETSEIQYAFLNANGHIGTNSFLLNEASLPNAMRCGVNLPSPDNLTPTRLESMIWTMEPNVIWNGKDCLGIATYSSFWQIMECNDTKGIAAACQHRNNSRIWMITGLLTRITEAPDACQKLSPEMIFSMPASGYENNLLYEMLTSNHHQRVWLNTMRLKTTAIFIELNASIV